MPLKKIRKKLKLASLSPVFGEICKINPTNLVGTNMSPKIGDLIKITENFTKIILQRQ